MAVSFAPETGATSCEDSAVLATLATTGCLQLARKSVLSFERATVRPDLETWPWEMRLISLRQRHT